MEVMDGQEFSKGEELDKKNEDEFENATFAVSMDQRYQTICSVSVFDQRLSFREKGLMTYFMMCYQMRLPISIKSMLTYTSEGKASIKSGLKNLEEFGYLSISQEKSAEGRFTGKKFDINPLGDGWNEEKPSSDKNENKTEKQMTISNCSPRAEFPRAENRLTDKNFFIYENNSENAVNSESVSYIYNISTNKTEELNTKDTYTESRKTQTTSLDKTTEKNKDITKEDYYLVKKSFKNDTKMGQSVSNCAQNENILIGDDSRVLKKSENEQLFASFWKSYPKKVGKSAAYKWFISRRFTVKVAKKILSSIDEHKKTDQWKDVRYIPMPMTYLHQGRWDDDCSAYKTSGEEREHADKMDLSEEERERVAKLYE